VLFPKAKRGIAPINYRRVLVSILLHAIVYMFLYNLLNVLVQIANKMGLQKNYLEFWAMGKVHKPSDSGVGTSYMSNPRQKSVAKQRLFYLIFMVTNSTLEDMTSDMYKVG
jgi:hypothetical protein